jgi:hypothetical protein
MLLRNCEIRENQPQEDGTFLAGVNEITFTRIYSATARHLASKERPGEVSILHHGLHVLYC